MDPRIIPLFDFLCCITPQFPGWFIYQERESVVFTNVLDCIWGETFIGRKLRFSPFIFFPNWNFWDSDFTEYHTARPVQMIV